MTRKEPVDVDLGPGGMLEQVVVLALLVLPVRFPVQGAPEVDVVRRRDAPPAGVGVIDPRRDVGVEPRTGEALVEGLLHAHGEEAPGFLALLHEDVAQPHLRRRGRRVQAGEGSTRRGPAAACPSRPAATPRRAPRAPRRCPTSRGRTRSSICPSGVASTWSMRRISSSRRSQATKRHLSRVCSCSVREAMKGKVGGSPSGRAGGAQADRGLVRAQGTRQPGAGVVHGDG